jgi:hypothetical protein
VAFGKRAYASVLLNCRFLQKKNVLVIQYEGEPAEVATCEQRGDWEADRRPNSGPVIDFIGGCTRTRTLDPLIKSQLVLP